MGIILLIMGIVFATRIPKYLKSTPAEFPGCDPNLHARWRAKELGSIYVFLGATWGQDVVFFIIGIAIGVTHATDPAGLNSLIGIVTAIEVAVLVGGLIWAAVLGSQASKLKKQLTSYQLPPSYYPRPGQALMQAPPVSPAPPVASPPAPEQPIAEPAAPAEEASS